MAPLRLTPIFLAAALFCTAANAAKPPAPTAANYSTATNTAPPVAAPPVVPATVTGTDGVKSYLLTTLKQMNKASADLKQDAADYTALIAANGGTPESAAKAKPAEMANLINKMRTHYGLIDSYGYEYVEGIVAGTAALQDFDVELDSGVPAKGAPSPDQIAKVKIVAGDLIVDQEGSLNNWLIETTVYGTNPRFTTGSATLPGFDKPVNLPNPKLITAEADYAIEAYARLTKASEAWKPTDADCFHILATMTPTLADYFDEWNQTKKGTIAGGRFVAVARLSDMRGIMSGTRLTWQAVAAKVQTKDTALAAKVTGGYDNVMKFLDDIEARDKKEPLTVEAIDALGTRAKELADKLTVQSKEAGALMGVEESGK